MKELQIEIQRPDNTPDIDDLEDLWHHNFWPFSTHAEIMTEYMEGVETLGQTKRRALGSLDGMANCNLNDDNTIKAGVWGTRSLIGNDMDQTYEGYQDNIRDFKDHTASVPQHAIRSNLCRHCCQRSQPIYPVPSVRILLPEGPNESDHNQSSKSFSPYDDMATSKEDCFHVDTPKYRADCILTERRKSKTGELEYRVQWGNLQEKINSPRRTWEDLALFIENRVDILKRWRKNNVERKALLSKRIAVEEAWEV
jgi:hypothetical protein